MERSTQIVSRKSSRETDRLSSFTLFLSPSYGCYRIQRKDDELGTLLTLRVHKEDMGTIIGKDGKTINSIRTVLRVFGSKSDMRLNLKIAED